MSQHKRSQNSWVGFVLILVGALFLLETFSIMDFGGVITNWWPAIFIIIGLIKLQGQDRGAGLILILIGALFLLTTHDIIGWGSIWRLWPLVLIIIGLSMVFKGRRSNWTLTNESTIGNDFIHSNAVFGGAEHTITSQNFKGGETMALFGGVEMIVPDDWNVILTGTPIFGGIESKSRSAADAKTGKDVYIHCTVAFGGVEIK